MTEGRTRSRFVAVALPPGFVEVEPLEVHHLTAIGDWVRGTYHGSKTIRWIGEDVVVVAMKRTSSSPVTAAAEVLVYCQAQLSHKMAEIPPETEVYIERGESRRLDGTDRAVVRHLVGRMP